MSAVFRILATAAVLSVFPILLRCFDPIRYTSLTTAWRWGLAVTATWSAVWGLTVLSGTVVGALSDQLWYAVSVIALCPPIAVLGARRPTSRVWNWFVLLPLVLVLGLPALTAWSWELEVAPLLIETPVLVGYGLVMIMGLGNYVGTRFTLSVMLLGFSQVLLLVPLCDVWAITTIDPDSFRTWGSLLFAVSLWSASLARPIPTSPGFDLLWRDFRNSFGIVWARRIQDRVNDTARKEQWPARLEISGFRWESGSDGEERQIVNANKKIEHALRWLLRRFVDPPWIDERLSHGESVG